MQKFQRFSQGNEQSDIHVVYTKSCMANITHIVSTQMSSLNIYIQLTVLNKGGIFTNDGNWTNGYHHIYNLLNHINTKELKLKKSIEEALKQP